MEKLKYGKPTTLGAASGAVAGLVAITPCAGFVSPLGSIAVGVLAGAGCALAVTLKIRLGFDDSLDVVAVHLIGGIIGSLCVGLFATLDTNPLGADGLFYGGGLSLLGKQALAVVCVMSYSFTISFILGKVINVFVKNRVTEEQEVEGLDLALHGETAYEFSTLTAGSGSYSEAAPAAVSESPSSAPAKEGVSA